VQKNIKIYLRGNNK
jgi:hypothetical protein